MLPATAPDDAPRVFMVRPGIDGGNRGLARSGTAPGFSPSASARTCLREACSADAENDPTRHSRNQTLDVPSASCALEILRELFPVVVGPDGRLRA